MNWLAALKTSANLDPAIQSAIRMDMAKFDRFMLALILFHAPFALFVIPFGYGTWIIGAIGSAIACTGALLAYFLARGTLLSRFAMANLLAVYSATFILQQFGRIEMHFHVFGSIAFLAIYRDWRVLLSPAPLVVVYHTVLNYCQVYNVEFLGFPLLIFNYGVGLDIVLVHAGFVVFETSVLVYYAAEFHARFVSEMQARLTIERRGQQVAARAEEIGSEIVNSSGELHSSAEELSSVATDQSASIEEMSASFEEISAGLDQLSATAQEQRAKLDNVNEKQKTLATLASAVKLQLDSVRKDSQEVQAEADRAGEALQLIIQSMRSIDSNSGQVRNIVAVINEIADRVNLLSLNASIEAARAGEYGRGFSVVAQEISRLADRTAESVNEINSLIDRNGLEVAAGRTKVSEGARVIGQLVERIKLVGDNLSELNNSLKRQESEFVHLGEEIVQMTEGVGRTLSSLGEQAETGRHIQDAMQGLATMSQRLVASAVELNRIMQSNRQQATELSDAVKALAGAG